MNLYSTSRDVSIDKNRGWSPAGSTAKLCPQDGKNRYVGREGVSFGKSSGIEYKPLIIFESLDHP